MDGLASPGGKVYYLISKSVSKYIITEVAEGEIQLTIRI